MDNRTRAAILLPSTAFFQPPPCVGAVGTLAWPLGGINGWACEACRLRAWRTLMVELGLSMFRSREMQGLTMLFLQALACVLEWVCQ